MRTGGFRLVARYWEFYTVGCWILLVFIYASRGLFWNTVKLLQKSLIFSRLVFKALLGGRPLVYDTSYSY